MSRTHKVLETDLSVVDIFACKEICDQMKKALNEDKNVERVESSFTDPGEDHVDFKIDGDTILHIRGY